MGSSIAATQTASGRYHESVFYFLFLIDGYRSVFGYELMETESLLSFASTSLAVNMHLLNELMMTFNDPLQCSILILRIRSTRKDGSCSEPQASRVNTKATMFL